MSTNECQCIPPPDGETIYNPCHLDVVWCFPSVTKKYTLAYACDHHKEIVSFMLREMHGQLPEAEAIDRLPEGDQLPLSTYTAIQL